MHRSDVGSASFLYCWKHQKCILMNIKPLLLMTTSKQFAEWESSTSIREPRTGASSLCSCAPFSGFQFTRGLRVVVWFRRDRENEIPKSNKREPFLFLLFSIWISIVHAIYNDSTMAFSSPLLSSPPPECPTQARGHSYIPTRRPPQVAIFKALDFQ